MSQIREIIRRLKPVYIANNVMNYGKLANSKELYKKYGLKKSTVSTLSRKDFQGLESEPAWLDRFSSSDLLPEHDVFQSLNKAHQESLKSWSDNGFTILESYFDHKTVDQMNQEVDALINSENVKFRYDHSSRIMCAIDHSAKLKQAVCTTELEAILSMLLGKEVEIFQSINFLKGSQQKCHSDSIHMTTHPLGYLIAAWIALEDVGPDQGPLFYYPGSHQLDYVLTDEFNPGGNYFMLGKKSYAKYEGAIQQLVEANGFEKKHFHAKKGDVLIWHANLLHGGEQVNDPQSSRKSMVLHYFAKDVIRYHEITQRPAIIPKR